MLRRVVTGIFLLVLFSNDINSQRIHEHGLDINRHSRQLDFGPCCPCPEDTDRSADIRYPTNLSTMARYNGESNMEHRNRIPTLDNFENYSSQSRNSDSEPSSSIFFPTSLATAGHSSRTSNKKEEPKNILEPEVGLAASVLETIREATEVEYQDALVRDAEKAREVDDAIPNESSPNIVTIILPTHSRDEDNSILSQTTRTQEPKDVKPFGSLLSKMRSPAKPNLLAKILKLPEEKPRDLLYRNIIDTDNNVQASSIQERVANKDLPDHDMKTDPELLNVRDDNSCMIDTKATSKAGNVKTDDSKMRLGNPVDNPQSEYSDSKPLSLSTKKHIFNTKNLLKLRDVEFIPPSKMTNTPLLKLSSILDQQLHNLTDLFRNGFNLRRKENPLSNVQNCDIDPNTLSTDIQTITSDNSRKTKILDTLPISGMDKIKGNDHDSETMDSNPVSNIQTNPRNKIKKTEIIDIIPSPSENNITFLNNNYGEFFNAELENNSDLPFTTNSDEASEEINNTNVESSEDVVSSTCVVPEDNINSRVTNSESEFIEDETTDDRSSNTYCLEGAADCLGKTRDSNEDNPDTENTYIISNASLEPDDNKSIHFPMDRNVARLNENLLEKLKQFRKTPTRDFNPNTESSVLTFKGKENPYRSDYENAASENQFDLSNQDILSDSEKGNSDNLSLKDLQRMSDSLLKMNDSKQKSSDLTNTDTNSDMTTSFMNKNNIGLEALDKINVHKSENTCLTDTQTLNREVNSSDHVKKEVEFDEMVVDASDSIMSAIHQGPLNLLSNLKSPLLQDVIVQPSSLIPDDLSPLSDGSNLDLSSLLNIPTLDEVRERLDGLLGNIQKESEREGIDCNSNNSIMSAKQSEHKFQTSPFLKPLEDINIDIFQLKPLKISAANLLPETTKLNLKSYKAKLPIPKNLELKPMKLESTIGNKGGLLGATLSIEPESDINRKLKNIFNAPIEKSSRLEEVASKLKGNVESLLSSPINMLQDFRSNSKFNTLTDDLGFQTLNKIKEIQEHIENPLKIQHSMLEQPELLLEQIADARDDLNDKLRGLKYDLDDRLSTIHENILDKTKLMSQSNPLLAEGNLKNSILKSLQQQNPSEINLEYLLPKSGKKIDKLLKPHDKSEFRKVNQLRSSQSRNGNEILKAYKMPTSASVPVPKSVQVPNLEPTAVKSSLLDFQKAPNVKHIAQNKLLEMENKPVFRVPSQSKTLNGNRKANEPNHYITGNKFKVTIASTTPSSFPAVKSRNINIATTTVAPTRSEIRLGKSQSNDKNNFEKTELNPSTLQKSISKSDTKTPTRSATINPIAEWLKQKQAAKTFSKESSKNKPDAIAPESSNKLKSAINNKSLNKKSNSWPEITENSFLSKLRDSVKARLDALKTTKGKENSKILSHSNDMSRAASEISDVVVSETLKENVSYKCKMLCTKEI